MNEYKALCKAQRLWLTLERTSKLKRLFQLKTKGNPLWQSRHARKNSRPDNVTSKINVRHFLAGLNEKRESTTTILVSPQVAQFAGCCNSCDVTEKLTNWAASDLTSHIPEAGFLLGEFVRANREKSNLIGWRQTLTTSPANHIRFLLIRANKFAKWKTGLNCTYKAFYCTISISEYPILCADEMV